MNSKDFDVQQAAQLYRDGATLAQIAEKCGVVIGTVHRRLIAHGVKMRKRGWGAATSPGVRFALASHASRVAHALGRAHMWTPEEARAASRKGVLARQRRREAAKAAC
ncbi:MAG: hypothetical protein V1755_01585 [Chloroflexota bacterium]